MSARDRSRRMMPPESGVRVRMYNPGFGDCFLLAFPSDREDEPVYVLIDCGVHGQYRPAEGSGSDRIRRILRHIRDATGGRIDVVVVTHEHADHLSGFHAGRHVIRPENEGDGGIEFGEGWFAWTEDPDNEQAKKLDKHRSMMLQGLYAAFHGLQGADSEKMEPLLGFYACEDDEPNPEASAATSAESTDAASGGESEPAVPRRSRRRLDANRFGISTRQVRDEVFDQIAGERRFLEPKRKPHPIPRVPGVRVFVLGPPEDQRLLLSSRPRKNEAYEKDEGHTLRLGADRSLVAALAASNEFPEDTGAPPSVRAFQPFAANHRISVDAVKASGDEESFAFFTEHYGFDDEHDHHWRSIETEWMNTAESIALKLDSATNNTSLVLAIELPRSKRVLLFPGDAQAGNWRSWHLGGWDEQNGLGHGESITAEDLLNRTVLYKVGHHGSHNATMQDQGLEMMTSPELVAMIPVDQEWAETRRPYPWRMPFGPMYEELLKRTQGRVVRTDGKEPPSAPRWEGGPGPPPQTETDGQGNLLYTEIDILDPPSSE